MLHLCERQNFWTSLERFDTAPALVWNDQILSYGALARNADAWAADLRTQLPANVQRPLVLIEAGNASTSIAAYLGALRAGWPVILSEPGASGKTASLSERYRPNVVVFLSDGAWDTRVAHEDAAEMHEDLALMLSTSGTTGASKLVRLSAENIASNTNAIIEYLGLVPEDRAITTLPWHYSYGLSVLQTQLGIGGALVLTDTSVIEPAFWAAARQHDVSVLPLVPTQFDLLGAPGDISSECPSLRILTQAGGRLDPAIARDYAETSRLEGWSFFVMYGQTEAAPRISYVPTDAPLEAYGTIGQPVPGGSLSIEDRDGAEVTAPGLEGQLVYRGPNVMMGYAETRDDLARPHETRALRTGDMAVRTHEGFFRIVGRASRFVKLNGLRIGLDEVETRLRDWGIPAHATGTDAQLHVFVTERSHLTGLRNRLAKDLKLASHQLSVRCLANVPMLASGKVDYATLKDLANAPDTSEAREPAKSLSMEDVIERALGVETIDPARSFRDYGGDSLSYLEVEIAMSERGLEVPENWDDKPLRLILDAAENTTHVPARSQVVHLDLIWRILAIAAVLANHATNWSVAGGAYFLMVLSGYSLARFQSPALFSGNAIRAMVMSLGHVLAWYFSILCVVHVIAKPVDLHWWILIGNYVSAEYDFDKVMYYWYISALAQVVLLTCIPFMFRSVRAWASERPFAAGMIALSVTTLIFEITGIYSIDAEARLTHTIGALQLATLGWCVYFADDVRKKVAITALIFALVGYHWNDAMPTAQAFITLGTLSLLYRFRLALPLWAARILSQLGGLTLMIYLLHPIVLSVVQRVGIGWADPNWPNGVLYAALVAGTVPAAIVLGLIERKVLRPAISRAEPLLQSFLRTTNPGPAKLRDAEGDPLVRVSSQP